MKKHKLQLGFVAALYLAAGFPALSQGIIESVVQIGGNPASPPAQYSGQTFNHPNLGENYTVPLFGEDVPSFTDRVHQWNGAAVDMPLPRYLVGNEYIQFGNDNRGEFPFQVDITVSQEAFIYLLIDNRLGATDNTIPPDFGLAMGWVPALGWEPVQTGLNRPRNPDLPDEVGVDEGAGGVGPGVALNQWSSVYVRRVDAGTVSIFEPDNPGRNMYGVVVRPVPTQPYVNAAVGDINGFWFEIVDGTQTSTDVSSVVVTLNGEPVEATVNRSGDRTEVQYTSPGLMPSESQQVATITFSDNASPANEFSDTLEFTIERYVTIPAAWSVSNPGTPGMLARVYKTLATRVGGNFIWGVENALSGNFIDPATGEPYANQVFPDVWEVDIVNWEQNGTDIGTNPATGPDFFNSARPTPTNPRFNDWIPGVFTPDPDNIAVEITGYIELPAGMTEMGVTSDDGFRLTMFSGTPDVLGETLGLFDGGRGAAESRFRMIVEEAGLYPFRLTWWEGGGGASVEWYSFDRNSGERILINDSLEPNSLKTFRTAGNTSPVIASVYPFDGTPNIHVSHPIEFRLRNGQGRSVDQNSIRVRSGGATATPDVQMDNGEIVVSYVPPGRWPFDSVVTVELEYAESGGGPVRTASTSFITLPRGPDDIEDDVLVIDTVEQIGGNPGSPTARFSGQIFDHPNLGPGYQVPLFGENVAAFTDRVHQWNGATVDLPIPGYLAGAEYIMMGNDNRAEFPFQVNVTISAEAYVYLLIDNRLGGTANTIPPDFDLAMGWVAEQGWEPVRTGHNRAGDPTLPDEVGVDEGAGGMGPGQSIEQFASIYMRHMPAGTFTLLDAENPGRNMYGVVVRKVPEQLITSVEQIGGREDRPAARFSGQVFDHPNLGTDYQVPFFGENVAAFTDRVHQWNGATADRPIPGYLAGQEYIMMSNDNRDADPFQVNVTLASEAMVYLLIDNRLGGTPNTIPPDFDLAMGWVAEQGWEPVRTGHNRTGDPSMPDEVGMDEGAGGTQPGESIEQFASIYVRRVPAGVVSLLEAENPGRNMYGAVVGPVPNQPYVVAADADRNGITFVIDDGAASSVAPATIGVNLNGDPVDADVSKDGIRTTVRVVPEGSFPAGTHEAVLSFQDTASPANTITASVVFTVESEVADKVVVIQLGTDSQLTLTWEGEAVLLESESIGGPYTPVDGATSPFTVEPTGSQRYYRID